MRKLFLVAAILFTGTAIAQEPADALRYSMMGYGGSARTRAIGGAVVSLGGDITAAAVNPAGLAFFKTSEFVFTPTLGLNNTKINYLGNDSRDKKTAFDISNFGFILPKEGSVNGNWRNFTVGLGMNRRANFNNQTSLLGINNESSYSEKYLEELINKNVTNPNDAANNFPYGASLALNTYLIDTISGPNGTIAGYRSLATPQSGVIQQQNIVTRGGINDYFIAASGNFMDRLFVGGGITFSQLKFDRTSTYRETDATKKANNFNYFETQETLLTEGIGVGINLGIIVRPVDQIRIGAAFHSPVFYNLEDLYTTKITTDVEGYQGQNVLSQSSRDFNNGEAGEFQYDYTNPMRFMFGISYIFQEVEDVKQQRGFISADIEFLNYGKSKFNTGSQTNGVNYLEEVNAAIKDQYGSAMNFRIGGELKFNTIMARLGYNYMGNAFQSTTLKGTQSNISGGLGYRNKGYFLDLTYVHRIVKDASFPYRLDNGFFAPGFVKGTNGNVVVTVGMKF
jgi:long-subunit fatty acid transport protein